jgi:Ca-activated chloride channel family protein
MDREQAEKLLAVVIFDDLDEASKAELLAYLQTDDELRERLADMRMAAKLTCDAVNDGPDPVLSKHRLKELERLAQAGKPRTRVILRRCLTAAAAVLVIGVALAGLLMPSLSRTRQLAFSAISRPDVKYAQSERATASELGYMSELATSEPRDRVSSRPEGQGGGVMGGMGGYGGGADGYGMGGMSGYGMVQEDRLGASDRRSGDHDIRLSGGTSSVIDLGPDGLESTETRLAQARQPAPLTRPPALRPSAEGEPLGTLQEGLWRQGAGRGGRSAAQNAPAPVASSQPSQPVTSAPARGAVARDAATPPVDLKEESRLQMRFGGGSRAYEVAGPVARTEDAVAVAGSGLLVKDLDGDKSGVIAADQSGPGRAWYYQMQNGREPGLGADSFRSLSDTKSDKSAIPQAGEIATSELAGWAETKESTLAQAVGKPVADLEMADRAKVPLLEDVPVAGRLFRIERPREERVQVQAGGNGARPSGTNEPSTATPDRASIAELQTATEGLHKKYADKESDPPSEGRIVANDPVPQVATPAQEGLNWTAGRETASDEVVTSVPMDRDADVRVYGLKNVQASNVARLINEVFQREVQEARNYRRVQAAGGATSSNVAIVAAADDRTNSVVVTGPSEIMNVVDDVIAKLDREPAEATQDASAKVQQSIQTVPVANEDSDILPSESRFKVVPVNPWVMTERDAQSTFALDVDTASYALCRRYIRNGFLPPVGAVRMEEFINAFDYAYPQRDTPTFSVYAEGAPSPFAPAGQDLTLLKIAVKARTVGRDQRRAAHLVLVIDASASMGQPDRLGVVQSALSMLVERLSEGDRVSLVTYANEARLHLEAVSARQRDTIGRAIDAIQPAGPTNLLAGLKLGYATARRSFVAGQINQVVLCSDGVANVGQVEAEAVLDEVAQDRKQGITLTCVGVGYGAYNDAFLESLADNGDGRYVFLDAAPEAQEAFVGQLTDTLQMVAKDARIQVQFDPARVRRYRLIGYENRDIEDQRFRDDTIDAGEVGSGQCSTALYELELTGRGEARDAALGTVFVRYRDTETDRIEEIARPLAGSIVRRRSVEEAPRFFLAAGAARFAEWLRQSEHAQHTSLADVQRLLDDVSAVLPLDRDIRDLAALAHQAQDLPRAP